jgi:hypothetical protein
MTGDAGGGGPNGLPACMAHPFAQAGAIAKDLWGSVISPWLVALAKRNCINALQFANIGGNALNDTTNGDVVQTLNKITGVPLSFNTTALSNWPTPAIWIGNDLGYLQVPVMSAIEQLSQQTFWDKIVGQLAPTYMFSLIPFPNRASIVPFIPGLRAVWDPNSEGFTFKARDIEVQDTNCLLPRQLRAMCVYSGQGCIAGGFMPASSSVNNFKVGGAYVGSTQAGTIMMRRAPSFLWDAPCVHRFTGHVTQIRSNAHNNPGAGNTPTGPTPDALKKDALNMLDRVAHAWYVAEVLKHRWGDISTSIRFDVAPGSSVSIEGTSGQFMTDGEARYGQVTHVTHAFDAQQQRCHSTFRVGYIHTAAEHNQNQFTIDSHPFYNTIWTGQQHITLS